MYFKAGRAAISSAVITVLFVISTSAPAARSNNSAGVVRSYTVTSPNACISSHDKSPGFSP